MTNISAVSYTPPVATPPAPVAVAPVAQVTNAPPSAPATNAGTSAPAVYTALANVSTSTIRGISVDTQT